MKFYSDFESAVYRYLKHYNEFHAQIKSIDISIQGIKEQIDLLGTVKATDYGKDRVQGGEEASGVESASLSVIELQNQSIRLQQCKHEIEKVLKRLDNALGFISDDARNVLLLKHIDGASWVQVADKMKLSERTCQRISRDGIKQVSKIMFPALVSTLDFEFIQVYPQYPQYPQKA